MWQSLQSISEQTGISAADIISNSIAVLSAFAGLIAAVAAWRAASASAKSAKEMVLARNQFARPVLTFANLHSFNVDLARNEIGRGISTQMRDAKIKVRNVGSGTAFGVSICWTSHVNAALAKGNFDIEGVNEILKEADLSLNWVDGGDRDDRIEIRRPTTGNREHVLLLCPMEHRYERDSLREMDELEVQVPSEVLWAQILLSLNEIVKEGGEHAYGAYIHEKDDAPDKIQISAKSITDEIVDYALLGRSGGGCYIPHKNDDGSTSMIAMVDHHWSGKVKILTVE